VACERVGVHGLLVDGLEQQQQHEEDHHTYTDTDTDTDTEMMRMSMRRGEDIIVYGDTHTEEELS
jgi:hypothetical protein